MNIEVFIKLLNAFQDCLVEYEHYIPKCKDPECLVCKAQQERIKRWKYVVEDADVELYGKSPLGKITLGKEDE